MRWESWGSSPLVPAVLSLTGAAVLGGGSPLLGSVRRAVGWRTIELAEEAMLSFTMLLKSLWLHDLPTVAAHHQEEVIMCWAVAIYRHVCEGKMIFIFYVIHHHCNLLITGLTNSSSPSFLRVMVSRRFFTFLLHSSREDPKRGSETNRTSKQEMKQQAKYIQISVSSQNSSSQLQLTHTGKC